LKEAFGKSCGVEAISKSIFPYEKWETTKDITSSTQFPHYGDFTSSLLRVRDENNIIEFYDVTSNKLQAAEWTSLRYEWSPWDITVNM